MPAVAGGSLFAMGYGEERQNDREKEQGQDR